MFYQKLFWYPASLIVPIALICGIFFGEAILMGWAHNWGLMLLFFLFVPARHLWKNTTRTDKRLSLFLLATMPAIVWTWTWMDSPWLFSTYVYLSMLTGWLAYLVGKGLEPDASTLNLPAKWLAMGMLPLILMPLMVTIFMDTRANMEEWVYMMPGFSNIRAVGHFIAIGAVAATAWAWHKNSTSPFWWGLIALLWMVGFWSGSRTGLAAGFFALIGTAFLCRLSWKAAGLSLGVFALGAVLSAPWPLPTYHFGAIERFSNIATFIKTPAETTTQSTAASTITGINQASSGRIDLWTRGVESIMNKPLTGSGLGNWQQDPYNNPERPFFHLHNIVLDTLHSFGLVLGTALLLTLLAGAGLALKQGWRIGKDAAFPVAMIFTSAGLALFDATLWMPLPAALTGMAIGSLMAFKTLKIEKKRLCS